MSTIRAVERTDIPGVARLVQSRFPQDPTPAEGMEEFWTNALFDQPWADPELPSLVGISDNGSVVGFIASHARRLRVGDRVVQAACSSHLSVDPDQPATAMGARLLARFMSGPQELSYSDTAIEVVARLWRAAGGRVDHTRSLHWMRVLRPGSWTGRMLVGQTVRRRVAAGLGPVRPLPLALGFRTREDRLPTAPLTAQDLVALDAAVSGWLRVRTAWDEPFARWMLEAVERKVGRGRLVARVVSRGDTPIGWFVYTQGQSGAAMVLQVAGRKREIDAIVGELFATARDDGMILLKGRLEPHLLEPLRARGCAIGFGDRSVVHSRNDSLLHEIAASGALLSRLDGEWW